MDRFRGQSDPRLPVNELRESEVDEVLFKALVARWKRHYLGSRQLWADRALFRSLHTANQACLLPGGLDTRLFDLGRSVALWVSALEILTHPGGKSWTGLKTVYDLLESVDIQDRDLARRRYRAPAPREQTPPRRSRICWLCRKIYDARHDFLHGNPIKTNVLLPQNSKESLFWIAPCLYRLALTGFLKPLMTPQPVDDYTGVDFREFSRRYDSQLIFERALMKKVATT